MDHSQYGEAAFLIDYFLENPPKYKILVDVGAKGMDLSNSYDLLESGWRGILAEPLPEHFKQLDKDFSKFNVIIANVAVSDFNGYARFYLHDASGHSSLVRKSDRWMEVSVLTLPVLLDSVRRYWAPHPPRMPVDFDLLSIDTEGNDGNIIRYMLQESNYRPTILMHEKNSGVDGELMGGYYDQIHETPGNRIWRRRQ